MNSSIFEGKNEETMNLRNLYWNTVMISENVKPSHEKDFLKKNLCYRNHEEDGTNCSESTFFDSQRNENEFNVNSETKDNIFEDMESKHICPLCFKSFNQKSNKTKHQKQVHEKRKPYVCPEKGCTKMFAQNSVKITHYKTVHCGDKPFSCPSCFKSFSDKSNMRKHLRNIHLKEKPFSCVECGSKFGEKRSLNDHINCVHLKKRPYMCPVVGCGRSFGQKTHMAKHCKTQHTPSQIEK